MSEISSWEVGSDRIGSSLGIGTSVRDRLPVDRLLGVGSWGRRSRGIGSWGIGSWGIGSSVLGDKLLGGRFLGGMLLWDSRTSSWVNSWGVEL